MIQNGSAWVPNGSPGRVVGASGGLLGALGVSWATPGVILTPIWEPFSGDVSFTFGHKFFLRKYGHRVGRCLVSFLAPYGRVWVPKYLQWRGTETRKQMLSLQESNAFDV